MIYIDSSIVLAELLQERRRPQAGFWAVARASSQLLVYEVWVRLHAYGMAAALGPAAAELLGRMTLLDLGRPQLDAALRPFPIPVRTLDALHMSTALFLCRRHAELEVATYDERMASTARALGLSVVSWS